MAESFYASAANPGAPLASSGGYVSPSVPSPTGATGPPPPPPPKPNSHAQSVEHSRSGTPTVSSTANTVPPESTKSPRPPPPIPTSPSMTSGLDQGPLQQAQPPQQIIPPPSLSDRWIPSQLINKPINELHPLVENPSLLAALASTHPSYASSLVPLQSAIKSNIQLAHRVAQVEKQLCQLRDETARLILNHTSLQTQWRRKQSEMDEALSPWGPRQMYQRLVSSINEQEAMLKAMQESFWEGAAHADAFHANDNGKASEKEVLEWVRRIREAATTLERRREMRARWDEGRVGGWR